MNLQVFFECPQTYACGRTVLLSTVNAVKRCEAQESHHERHV